jgi:hypothetical protein
MEEASILQPGRERTYQSMERLESFKASFAKSAEKINDARDFEFVRNERGRARFAIDGKPLTKAASAAVAGAFGISDTLLSALSVDSLKAVVKEAYPVTVGKNYPDLYFRSNGAEVYSILPEDKGVGQLAAVSLLLQKGYRPLSENNFGRSQNWTLISPHAADEGGLGFSVNIPLVLGEVEVMAFGIARKICSNGMIAMRGETAVRGRAMDALLSAEDRLSDYIAQVISVNVRTEVSISKELFRLKTEKLLTESLYASAVQTSENAELMSRYEMHGSSKWAVAQILTYTAQVVPVRSKQRLDALGWTLLAETLAASSASPA